MQTREVAWTRSSFCADTNCVELATVDGEILLRDSKVAEGGVLRFSRSEWDDFRTAVAAGEFTFQ